jgi:hypothetical protein
MNNETVSETSTVKPEMTYGEKMTFLMSVRHECGLDVVDTDNLTNECDPDKYIVEYGMGSI